jgi:hypothetical protein
MNEEVLKKQIELLEQIIELQKQLIAAKGISYPVYYPYVPYQPFQSFPYYKWEPYTYTSGAMDGTTVQGNSITYTS